MGRHLLIPDVAILLCSLRGDDDAGHLRISYFRQVVDNGRHMAQWHALLGVGCDLWGRRVKGKTPWTSEQQVKAERRHPRPDPG
jgi:hypothetical protein